MEDLRQTVHNIFVGSFNLNGSSISALDSMRWLRTKRCSRPTKHCCETKSKDVNEGVICVNEYCNRYGSASNTYASTSSSAYESGLVILSLQECPTPPSCNALHYFDDLNHRNELPLIRVFSPFACCLYDRTSTVENEKDTIRKNIHAGLSEEHHLVTDIAMGEAPSEETAKPRWYGYIRLLIFAKDEILKKLRTSARHEMGYPAIIPIFAPAGRKADDSSNYKYQANRSPDKGAVCVFFPLFNLLVCSLHLCGTNAYNIPEAHFDAIRIKELNIIAEKCQKVIGMDRTCAVILCGDLNFRIEVMNGAKDKSRGGKDYQIVHGVLREGSVEAIQNMFWKYDRLIHFLKILERHQEYRELDEYHVMNLLGVKQRHLLLNLRDAFDQYMGHLQGTIVGDDITIIYPTFPLVVDSQNDRTAMPSNADGSCSTFLESLDGPKYSDKRTPSWTDRILLSETFLQSGYRVQVFGADHKINSNSDHAPVYAIFTVSATCKIKETN